MTSSIVQAKEILPHVTDKLGSSRICTGQSDTEFELVIQLNHLSSVQAAALGLSGVTALCMHVKLQSAIYYRGYHRPVVEFKVLAHSTSYSEPYGAILSHITKMSKDFFADNWPCQTRRDTFNFLPGLYRHVQARTLLLGSLCVAYGRQHDQVSLDLLPRIMRAFRDTFNEPDTESDLSDIYSRPVIADLFISMASAACQCINRRDSLFQSMPSHLFSTEQGNVSQQIDWQRMQDSFHGLASVAAMANEPNLQDFFINNHLHRELQTFQFLRWILNSCKGHLMQLQGEDRFSVMTTEYQFCLCTDSPSKEAAFSQLKEKYGSRFLFHGSPFYNWHSILQNGLKYAGCHGLASNTLYYSQGIYLAEDSGVSAAYCQYRDNGGKPAYPNSIFGQSPLCIALCEVIDDFGSSNTHNSVRVQMDPNKVIAGYLFVFRSNDCCQGSPDAAIPSVQAAALYEICEKHARKQAAVLVIIDAVEKELQGPENSDLQK